jgi:hypothetical protein
MKTVAMRERRDDATVECVEIEAVARYAHSVDRHSSLFLWILFSSKG